MRAIDPDKTLTSDTVYSRCSAKVDVDAGDQLCPLIAQNGWSPSL